MSIASAHVAVFRDQWADRFIDACNVRRLASRGAINPITLVYTESEPNVATTQECLYRPNSTTPTVTEFGQTATSRTDGTFHFPYDAPELRVEDTIELTVSDNSPNMVGKTFRVLAIHFDSYQTHKWVDVEFDQGSGE